MGVPLLDSIILILSRVLVGQRRKFIKENFLFCVKGSYRFHDKHAIK
jgi:hypothetical protein